MKMKIEKCFNKLIASVLLLVAILLVLPFTTFADDSSVYFDDIVLGVGANEGERNLTWYTSFSSHSYVKYAKTEELSSGVLGSDAKIATATRKTAENKPGYTVNNATLTDLSPDTEYTYQLVTGSMSSSLFTFKTDALGDFDFVFVGDPQISTENHGISWADTLEKLEDNFDPSLIILGGDNVSTADSEEMYSYFLVDGMANTTFAPTVGPGHDSPSSAFSEHFNIPNGSDRYGVNETSANYWYTYNNTLFMHLNMSDTSAARNGEHLAFMEEVIEENPGVNWKVVILHNALFSAGNHSDPDYMYFESEIKPYREILAPQLTACGIDLVLSGHDHIYVRSNFMNGDEPSGATPENNYIKDPVGTLHIAASSSTGSKFYENCVGDANYIAKLNDEKRKSAIHFEITETTLAFTSYFLDDMSEFDTLTIAKSEHIHNIVAKEYVAPECESSGYMAHYMCDICGLRYKDSECTILIPKADLEIAPIGHEYKDATCTKPKTCINGDCKHTIGKALGHDLTKADCETPITCTVCGITRGKSLGHEWDSDCDDTCNRDGCDHTREPQHNDENTDGFCDGCRLSLVGDAQDDKPIDNSEKGSGNNSGIIIVISAILGTAVLISAIIFIIIKKRKK